MIPHQTRLPIPFAFHAVQVAPTAEDNSCPAMLVDPMPERLILALTPCQTAEHFMLSYLFRVNNCFKMLNGHLCSFFSQHAHKTV